MRIFELKKYGNVYQIRISVQTYTNGNLAIQLYLEDSEEDDLYSTLTVNLGIPLEKNCAFIDTNNNGNEILQWIERYNLAVPTGRIGRSGYCEYPEYRFPEPLLQDIDPDGYATHLQEREELTKS